jgi:hypothetical protein
VAFCNRKPSKNENAKQKIEKSIVSFAFYLNSKLNTRSVTLERDSRLLKNRIIFSVFGGLSPLDNLFLSSPEFRLTEPLHFRSCVVLRLAPHGRWYVRSVRSSK